MRHHDCSQLTPGWGPVLLSIFLTVSDMSVALFLTVMCLVIFSFAGELDRFRSGDYSGESGCIVTS